VVEARLQEVLMFGLPDDWDDDVCDERTSRAHAQKTSFRVFSPDEGLSKVEELLKRASEAVTPGSEVHVAPLEAPTVDCTGAAPPRHMELDGPPAAEREKTKMCSTLAELPRIEDADVQAWFSAAPRLCARGVSFRASSRRGLVALPVRSGSGGFRIKLLQLAPSQLTTRQERDGEEEKVLDGVGLLEAHLEVTGGRSLPERWEGLAPPLLLPRGEDSRTLLKQYLTKACTLGKYEEDTLSLIGGLCDSKDGLWPPDASAIRRLGVWMSRVNEVTVGKHLETAAKSAKLRQANASSTAEATAVANRLDTTFHRLTANSVCGALNELVKADAVDGCRTYFDRLAGIVAACGGSACGASQARRSLRRQLDIWRLQGVPELMGPALWRIYSLLAGDLDDIVADALDWRTAFGMYVWYHCEEGTEPRSVQEHFVNVVEEFEAAVRRRGLACHFRPVPPYSHCTRKVGAEPADLQYSILKVLVKSEWQDLKQFDYVGHTSRPLDVAFSWHVCSLLISLSDVPPCAAFQLLTQQYCMLLELLGQWEWAIYVALFITDARARSSAIQGLMSRNVSPVKVETVRKQWPGLPQSCLRRAQAFRFESAWNWLPAVTSWLAVGGRERALLLAVGFLQAPVVLQHAVAPVQRGPMEVHFAPMGSLAVWLLGAVEELVASGDRQWWAEVGRVVHTFMLRWSNSSDFKCQTDELARLCLLADKVRPQILGVPW